MPIFKQWEPFFAAKMFYRGATIDHPHRTRSIGKFPKVGGHVHMGTGQNIYIDVSRNGYFAATEMKFE